MWDAYETRFYSIARTLNRILSRICWIASIGLWLWIVTRSHIWTYGFTSNLFWANFWIFLAAGLGTVATSNFAASAIPLTLGILTLTAHDGKPAWALLNLYVVAATAIGLVAAIIKVGRYVHRRYAGPSDEIERSL